MSNGTKTDRLGKLVFSGKNAEIQAMIDSGINLDDVGSNQWTPLMMAVEGDQPKTLELLLKNGANPNKQSGIDGFTALHLAIDYAMDGMIQNNKSRPYPEPIECIRILLKYGADKNIKDYKGRTPLDLYPITKEILAEFEAI